MSDTLFKPKADAGVGDCGLTGKYLSVKLRGESFAVEVLRVREIIRRSIAVAILPIQIHETPNHRQKNRARFRSANCHHNFAGGHRRLQSEDGSNPGPNPGPRLFAQISLAGGQMDKVTQSNAVTAEESAAAAKELNSHAELMKQSVAELFQLVGGRSGSAASKPTTAEWRIAPAQPAFPAAKRRAPFKSGSGNGDSHSAPESATAAQRWNEILLGGDFKGF